VPTVSGDPLRLRQCLVNLITNAIKYSHPSGRVLLEWTEADSATGFVRVTVEDCGVGIPPERMGDLFKPFTRLHAALDYIEGAGIGLAMTRQLIEAMGGRISAESAPGHGSRFHLDIPMATAAARRPARMAAYRMPLWPIVNEKRKVVLYVEDNPTNVHLMESLFKAIPGTDLRIARDAEAALELAATNDAVRAIILDINLPDMDGFEALMRLRAMRATADVPVIGLSARAGAADIERASSLGFYRYLTKPVNVPELLETLRAVL
jgi:CheY-like chemotaxis protein